MNTGRREGRVLRGAVLTGLVFALAACGQQTSAEGAGTPTSGRSTSSPPAAAPSASVPDELSAEQALANNPPPPRQLRAALTPAGAVELSWAPPPPVEVAHTYSDLVVGYRVYRRGPGDAELRPIGVTPQSAFRDRTAQAGKAYDYAVSSIRQHDVEGSQTDAVSVRIP